MASKKVDHTLVVLREIRDAVQSTNIRLDVLHADMNKRLDATNERLDVMNKRLEAGLFTALGDLRRRSVDRIAALEGRVDALEQKAG